MQTTTQPVRRRIPDAGSLDRRLTIQRPVVTANEYNEEVTTWADVATVSALVEWTGTHSDEQFEGDQQVVTTRAVFTIRYRTDFDEKCRLVFEGEAYDILHLAEIQRRRFRQITAEKRI